MWMLDEKRGANLCKDSPKFGVVKNDRLVLLQPPADKPRHDGKKSLRNA